MKLKRVLILFSVGAVGYCLLETLWRGYTHWTMGVCGGCCLMLLEKIGRRFSKRHLFTKCALGCAAITAVEFAAGCIVNLLLGWDVWSYAGMRGNLLGQICLRFVGLWYLLCIPVFLVFAKILKFEHKRPVNGYPNTTALWR